MSTSQDQQVSMTITMGSPVDTVWTACTSQESLRAWFNDTVSIEPRVGGAVRWTGTQGDEPYTMSGRIVELDAPRRMVLDVAADGAPSRRPTQLTFEIATAPDGDGQTTVTLRHTGLAGDDELAAYFERFWDGDELVPLQMYLEGVGPTA